MQADVRLKEPPPSHGARVGGRTPPNKNGLNF